MIFGLALIGIFGCEDYLQIQTQNIHAETEARSAIFRGNIYDQAIAEALKVGPGGALLWFITDVRILFGFACVGIGATLMVAGNRGRSSY
jgi:hypothetical protein